jgi:Dolichyl-phosphate-mannose-protein mannosyltransferase
MQQIVVKTSSPRSTSSAEAPRSRPDFATAIVLSIAAVRLLLWLLFATKYGYFRDELYYFACAQHLDWGYVDQPPLIAAVVWLVRHTLGDGLHALRFLPALADSATIVLAAWLAREMGGRRFAQILAAVGVLVAPVYMMLSHLMTMNAFEPLIWTTGAYLIVRVINTGDQRLWLWFGVLCGIGLENKYSIGLWGIGVILAIVITPLRRSLLRPYLWLAGGIAFLIFLPNLLWQWHRGFPFLILMRNVRLSGRDVGLSPTGFIGQQLLVMNPFSAIIWVAGLVWLFTRAGKRYRALAWVFLTVFVGLMVLKGKNYYVVPIYPMMFAAGGVAWEMWGGKRAWVRRTAVAFTAVATVVIGVFLPMFLPVLSPRHYIAYAKALHFSPPEFEHQQNGPLNNQIYADMFGWEEMTREVARIWNTLTPEEQKHTIIYANGGYGEASALNFFGPTYGLPTTYSGHQNYYFWPPTEKPQNVIVTRETVRNASRACDSVVVAGHAGHVYARRDEQFDILLCRGFKLEVKDWWPSTRRWN